MFVWCWFWGWGCCFFFFVSYFSCYSSCFAVVVLLPPVSHRCTKHQAPHCNELGPNLKQQTGASLPGFVMKLYTLTLHGFAPNAWKKIWNILAKYIVFVHGHLNYHGKIRQKNHLKQAHNSQPTWGELPTQQMGLRKAWGGKGGEPLGFHWYYPGSPTTICYSVR